MNRLRAPHDVEVEEPIMRHAQTHRPALEEFFDPAAITFEEVPLLRLAGVLASILSCSVGTMARAERKHMNCARGEHCKIKIVRV